MSSTLETKKNTLDNCADMAQKIIDGLEDDDIRKSLNIICMIEDLPDISSDAELKTLKRYKEVKDILKKVYVTTARTIISILSSDVHFSSDAETSFNYIEPMEPLLAAEYMKLLPNAFVGGPMKAAINCPMDKVQQIAVEHYDSLPSDFKYSGIFPSEFKKRVRQLRESFKGK
ncbi:MAG: hypothetical protein GY754_32835 [bacterium]|nr:hypothetical protein [bacterium]